MGATSISRAKPADVADLAPLFDAYRQFYGRPTDLRLATDFLRERITLRESVVLLARAASGEACGFAQLYPMFSSVRAARGYLLNDLFVPPRWRRNGVGRLLLEAAVQLARAEGVSRLKLSTAISNAPAQRLYESLGWRRDTEFYEYNLDV
jgi:ribosomal protein S18 acetylase RimI-like enzyme